MPSHKKGRRHGRKAMRHDIRRNHHGHRPKAVIVGRGRRRRWWIPQKRRRRVHGGPPCCCWCLLCCGLFACCWPASRDSVVADSKYQSVSDDPAPAQHPTTVIIQPSEPQPQTPLIVSSAPRPPTDDKHDTFQQQPQAMVSNEGSYY